MRFRSRDLILIKCSGMETGGRTRPGPSLRGTYQGEPEYPAVSEWNGVIQPEMMTRSSISAPRSGKPDQEEQDRCHGNDYNKGGIEEDGLDEPLVQDGRGPLPGFQHLDRNAALCSRDRIGRYEHERPGREIGTADGALVMADGITPLKLSRDLSEPVSSDERAVSDVEDGYREMIRGVRIEYCDGAPFGVQHDHRAGLYRPVRYLESNRG
jgi:hypothetical protein